MGSSGSSSSPGASPPLPSRSKANGYTSLVVAPAQSTANLRQAQVQMLQFENDTLNWLTYESVYDDDKYTHTDEVRPMGFYNMPLSNLRIIAASNVVDGDTKLNSLYGHFLPLGVVVKQEPEAAALQTVGL
ncbi:uncharacterized protein A1O5_09906 [Cladophialophora psammophila CBS 110553]|uniref:Uncharacterized protein n=1 Tax=Cladophialophora psammophila CBS 110553 TaxID=1182543 RepID=W9XA03_9EURO|nr:uncharacterized protein A1O5_09906 [Cladophialophora psammophila CBS 110553]EXJ67259.1 hypothetical protein A1O5_09906 [Cladophialophora psammophila CBS 110553]